MIRGKTILSLSPFPAAPVIHGAIARIHFLNRGLAETNRLFFVYRGDPASEPPRFDCQAIPNSRYRPFQVFNPALVTRLLRLIHSTGVDLIISNHIWSGPHGLLLKALTGRPLLFDNHNVEHVRFKRVKSPVWPLVWLLEGALCRVADQVSCVSEIDRDSLIARLDVAPARIRVVPNGVDVQGCSRWVDVDGVRQSLRIGTQNKVALFFGNLDYPPNEEAVDVILQEIAPRLGQWNSPIQIVIAGHGGSETMRSRLRNAPGQVVYAGFVEDIVAAIKSSDVVMAPLSAGSGTRFKILEGVSCGRRVVSTTIGAEGLDRAALGDSLVICDDWDAFTKALLETALLGPLAPSSTFTETYDWHHIVQRMHI